MLALLKKYNYGRTLVPDKYKSKELVYVVTSMLLIIDMMNFTAGLLSIKSLVQQFNVSFATASWVTSAFALTLAGFIIVWGKLADILGVLEVFMAGCFIMSIFGLLCAAVDKSVVALIVFRALQGIGGSAVLPSGMALPPHYFTGKKLDIAVLVLIVCYTGAFSLGCIISGAFTLTDLHYRAYFYFSFAASFTLVIFLYFFSVPIKLTHKMSVRSLNFVTAILFIAGFLLIVLSFTEAANTWRSPKVYVTLPIGVLTIIGAVLFENVGITRWKARLAKKDDSQFSWIQKWIRDVDLMFPFEVFKLPNYSQILVLILLDYAVCYGAVIAVLQYNNYVTGDNSLIMGLKVVPFGVGMILGGGLYNKPFVDKTIGDRNLLVLVGLVFVGMTVWLSRFDPYTHNEYWKLQFVPLIFIGINCNLINCVYFGAIFVQTPLNYQAVVSGIFATCCQVGVAFATALVATMLGDFTIPDKKDHHAVMHLVKKFRNSCYLTMAFGVLVVIAALFFKNVPAVVPGAETGSEGTEEREDLGEKEKEIEAGGSAAAEESDKEKAAEAA